jgi:hypothetical protein
MKPLTVPQRLHKLYLHLRFLLPSPSPEDPAHNQSARESVDFEGWSHIHVMILLFGKEPGIISKPHVPGFFIRHDPCACPVS